MKTNLLHETIEVLKEHGLDGTKVWWVGIDTWFTWDEFAKLADFTYNNGYGDNVIHLDLVVVGKDWWLERYEYDGSEWWEFKKLPIKPDCHSIPESLRKTGWM